MNSNISDTSNSQNHPARQALMASILSEMDDEKNFEDDMKKLQLLTVEKANAEDSEATGSTCETKAS